MSDSANDYMSFFFQQYVLHVLGKLPTEAYTKYNEVRLYTAFQREEEDWTVTIPAVLQLSETVEVAIWHLWVINATAAEQRGDTLDPEDYAFGFVENYYKEESRVDIWEGDQLEEAKRQIAAYQAQYPAE